MANADHPAATQNAINPDAGTHLQRAQPSRKWPAWRLAGGFLRAATGWGLATIQGGTH